MRVGYETLKGNKYEGEIIEIDNNVLYIKLDDGTIKAVESSGVFIINK